jgi:hypothetical protein
MLETKIENDSGNNWKEIVSYSRKIYPFTDTQIKQQEISQEL